MVDRLEELLALLEDEDDDGEREDVPALGAEKAVPAAPASGLETEDAAEGGRERAADAPAEDGSALAEAETLSWVPDGKVRSALAEGQDEVPGADGSDAGAVEGAAVKHEAAEAWWDEPAAPVMGPNGSLVLRRPGAGDVELLGPDGRPDQAGAAEADAAMGSVKPAEQGLEKLYQQTVRAGRAAVQAAPAEQAGRTAWAEEPGRTAALTVDELDRAVRRDSRRYDGGMTLF